MSKIISLDLNHQTLFGWESEKSDLVIDSIIRGIEAGDEFPPVPVHEENGKYYLSPLRETPDGISDAGHYRAIGHYIANKPLRCELLNRGPIWQDSMMIPIPQISIVDDSGQFQEHKNRFPQYR